ncbi:PQQ-binding-like beta-propeller repeat protein [Actinoplanes sp. CA-142083]|uniref:outer membrane protein assembly factor BamB family protein n=1 Tax=Actinoplanes sp. CA-142083 TaxID=3239903 RepID=UPI003D946160
MSAIDLGDVTAGPAQAPEPPMYSRGFLQAALAVLTVLGLSAIAASERAGPSRLLRPLWSIAMTDLSQFSISGGTLFVLNNGWDVTAYALTDGRMRWSSRLSEHTEMATDDLGSLLVPSGYTRITKENAEGYGRLDTATAATLALDPTTGIQRWQVSGATGYRDAGTALLVEADPQGGRPKMFREVRITDGAVLWAHPAGHPQYWLAGAGHLVTVGDDGRAEVSGLADGTAVSRGPLPLSRKELSAGVVAEVDATALYLKRNEGGRLIVRAFDLATLRPSWSVDGGATAREAHLCGGVMCLSDGTATSAFDLDSGRLRWRAPGWIHADTVTGGRLLAERALSTGEGLLDAATGALVADLGSVYPVWDAAAGTPTFLLRDTVRPPGRTAVLRLDSRSGSRRLQGSIEGLPVKPCVAVQDRLICKTTTGMLTVVAVA